MHDDDEPTPDPILSLLASAPFHEDILDGITDGFPEARAREILASPRELDYLRTMATHVAPGAGWIDRATTHSEQGELNLQLLHQAMEARVQTRPTPMLAVDVSDQRTVVRPSRMENAADDSLWHVALPDGEATFAVDDLQQVGVTFTTRVPPAWVEELLGPTVATALERGEQVSELFLADEAHPLARYALGCWLHRWHPGTGRPEAPFDEQVLRLELGALAWLEADLVGTAAEWLEGTGAALRHLSGQVQNWSGWRRELADGVLLQAARAHVAALPDAPEAPRIRELLQGLEQAEVTVLRSLAQGLEPRDFSRERALTASGSEGREIRSGYGPCDVRRVPPRSVRGTAQPVLWKVIPREGGAEMQVSVQAGDAPVAALEATITADGVAHDIRLPLGGLLYVGSVVLDHVPESVQVDLWHPDHPGGPRSLAEQETTRLRTAELVAERRDIFRQPAGLDVGEFPQRPFLAELLAWDPSLASDDVDR